MSDAPADIKDDNSVVAPEQSKKKKEKKKPRKRSGKKTSSKTKVVVRRLPPNIPQEVFSNSVKGWINEATIDWQLFVPGKLSSR
jgi:regulator of nonsense transcripts 3